MKWRTFAQHKINSYVNETPWPDSMLQRIGYALSAYTDQGSHTVTKHAVSAMLMDKTVSSDGIGRRSWNLTY